MDWLTTKLRKQCMPECSEVHQSLLSHALEETVVVRACEQSRNRSRVSQTSGGVVSGRGRS